MTTQAPGAEPAERPSDTVDVCIVGLGPTGRGLASRCLASGLTVAAVDPHPDRLWVPTYSCWVDELPAWLPESVIASRIEAPTVWTLSEHRIERPYAVMSKTELWKALPIAGGRVEAQKATSVGAHRVELADGTAITAEAVFDCRGLPPVGTRPAASAHGIFIEAERVAEYVPPGEALLLDWRNENDAAADAPPSFLYSVPIGDGTVIFEETTLAIPGGLTQRELRRRVIARLRSHGIELDGSEHSESCHYPLDQPPPGWRGRKNEAIPFGSRGGMMHPCTGYSVADSLALVDTVVNALVSGDDPVGRLWTPRARAVYWMRERGLAGMGRLTTEQTVAMFDSFFRASPRGQRALLSAHDDATALGAVLFNTVAHTWPFRWRFDLMGWTNRNRWKA
ncbi:lycopene cyclase family protein [Aldersonia kunmingensis]|uniref:lycopene cyclase family protein n=1 Tax=Aldersonia kunmingensis TaxID=408066 RepID=UPI00082B984F|nr:lycopene cyclase family protein [Aldersonia kunmingensis]